MSACRTRPSASRMTSRLHRRAAPPAGRTWQTRQGPSWRTPWCAPWQGHTELHAMAPRLATQQSKCLPSKSTTSRDAYSTCGPQPIGTQRSPAVGRSRRCQVRSWGNKPGCRTLMQNPDKDEAGGSSPPRPTTDLTSANAGHRVRSSSARVGVGSRTLTWLTVARHGARRSQSRAVGCGNLLAVHDPRLLPHAPGQSRPPQPFTSMASRGRRPSTPNATSACMPCSSTTR
jgi:hypothetical protein